MGKVGTSLRGSDIRKCTDKERTFVLEYVIDYNATRAAKAAGYKDASAQGSRLLKRPHIKRLIGKENKLDEDQFRLTRKRVLRELAYAVLRDPIDLCDENGRIVVDDMRKLPEHIRRCIDGIKVKSWTNPETGEITQELELKLISKGAALDMAMKHKGLFAPTEHNVNASQQTVDFMQLLGRTLEEPDPIQQRLISEGHTPTQPRIIDAKATSVKE